MSVELYTYSALVSRSISTPVELCLIKDDEQGQYCFDVSDLEAKIKSILPEKQKKALPNDFIDIIWNAEPIGPSRMLIKLLGMCFFGPKRIRSACLADYTEQELASYVFSHLVAVTVGGKLQIGLPPKLEFRGSSYRVYVKKEVEELAYELWQSLSPEAKEELEHYGIAEEDEGKLVLLMKGLHRSHRGVLVHSADAYGSKIDELYLPAVHHSPIRLWVVAHMLLANLPFSHRLLKMELLSVLSEDKKTRRLVKWVGPHSPAPFVKFVLGDAYNKSVVHIPKVLDFLKEGPKMKVIALLLQLSDAYNIKPHAEKSRSYVGIFTEGIP